MAQTLCSCGCGTAVLVTVDGLEITIPADSRPKAIHHFGDETMVTLQFDANSQERLILALKARFRERV